MTSHTNVHEYQKITTATQAAKNLNLPESTLRSWTKKYKIPTLKKSGRRLYSEEAIELIKNVRELKKSHSGYETITRVIRSKSHTHTDHSQESQNKNNKEEHQRMRSHVSEVIQNTLKEQSDSSEKYARATFEIGQLKERVLHLEEKIDIQKNEIKLLPLPIEYETTKLKLEYSQNKTQSQNEKIQDLEEKLKTEQDKTWFQKLFRK